MLLWIKGAIAPEEIWNHIKDPNSIFSESLVKYLESCHAGEFITGTKETVEKKVELEMASENYEDPTETLPVAPLPVCTITNHQNCDKCTAMTLWTKKYYETVDDLLLKSNVHTCTTNRSKNGSQHKLCSFTCCLDNIWNKCKAQFPRPLFEYTTVDKETGSLNCKKRESMLKVQN
ncbi:hypothetical protein L208DRAFT_1263255 [Tricholoma matsutake]|nr:hypothetical protein L208DRAFT_1263255 [Tricholoma matsutake 945]